MSDKDLVIDVSEKDTTPQRIPMFTVASAVYPMEDGSTEDLDFQFQAKVPKHPNIMDWITFLYLTKTKVDKIYNAALEQAVNAYLELREGVSREAAQADLESFLSARIEEENVLGLRDVDDDED